MDGLPEQVRLQAERLEEAEKALFNKEPEAQVEVKADDPHKAENVQTPPPAQAPVVPAVEAKPEVPKQDETVAELQKRVQQLEDWNKRLNGKIQKEIPAYADETRALKDERDRLKTELEAVKAGQADNTDYSKLLSGDPDAEVVGQEFVRIAAKVTDQKMKALKAEIESTKKTSEEREFATFKDTVYAQLPNYNAIDSDPKFDEWLKKPDRYGRTYDEALGNAIRNRKVDTVVSIYKDFEEAMKPVVTPPVVPVPKPDPLKRQVSPKPVTVTTPVDETKKFPYSAYKSASREFQRGRLTKAEMDEVEVKFNQAMADGTLDLSA